MPSFRDLRLLLVLIVAFAGLYLLIGSEEAEEPTDPAPSSYNATYPGLKACYLLLDELGLKPRRLTGRFPKTIDHNGVLVVAHPTFGVTDRDIKTMLTWVRKGGHLFLIGDDFTDPNTGDPQEGITLTRSRTGAGIANVSASSSSPFSQYVGPMRSGPFRYKKTPPSSTKLYGDARGALLVEWREGKGRITALADADPLTNRYLNDAGNARLAVWMMGKEPALFDEYHQGYAREPEEPSFWKQLGAPLRLALYQIFFAALLMGWTLSRRFGKPIVPPFEGRRTAGEYVISLGTLMRRAGADRTALEIVGRTFRQELAAWVGAPPDLPDAELLEAAAERAPFPRERIARALEASHGRPPAGMDALKAYRLIAEVREELNLHGRSAIRSRA
jgi:hypothetical protein